MRTAADSVLSRMGKYYYRESETCVDGAAAHQAESLEAVGFLRESKAGKCDSLPGTRHLDTKRGFGFGARLPEHGESGERFVVNLRHQIVFPASVLLPHLADLDFASRHDTTLDTNPESVNNRAQAPPGRNEPIFGPFQVYGGYSN
jgi:hypothetical protein